jgi:hypothetical protein
VNFTDVLVAEFQESIIYAIPQIIAFLMDTDWNVRMVGADALLKLAKQGKVSKFLTCTLLMYS